MFEYLAAGLPIIASRQGQIAKLLQDGTNGILYPPEAPGEREQLTQALSRFLRAENAAGMGAANRRLAREHTWHANAKRILAVIRSTLESRREATPTPERARGE
jgi:glycosyltransferase involved in cell wall biosynthesis